MFWHRTGRPCLHLPGSDGPILRRKVVSLSFAVRGLISEWLSYKCIAYSVSFQKTAERKTFLLSKRLEFRHPVISMLRDSTNCRRRLLKPLVTTSLYSSESVH